MREVGVDVRRPTVLVVVALLVAVVGLALAQGGAAYFIQLGDESRNLSLAREVLGDDVPVPLADGHDGEAFWLLARDPLLLEADLADRFDRPTYRAQRIGYPALAAPWRLLGEHALAWGLVLTNVAIVGIGTWLTGLLALRRGLRPEWAYAFALNPLVLMALLFDFSDALALAGVLAVLVGIDRRSDRWVAFGSVVGALAKESSLVALGSIAVLSRGLPMRTRVMAVLPGAVASGLWRLYVISRPGFGSDPQVQEFEPIPFFGYLDAWRRSWRPFDSWFNLAVAVALAVLAAAVVVVWWRRGRPALLAAAVGPALLVPFLSAQVVALPTNSVRAVGPVLTVLVLSVAARKAMPHAAPVTPRALG